MTSSAGAKERLEAAILGDQFSVVDGYALVFYGWGKRIGLPVEELENDTAWKERMLAHPAVRRVLEREQNVLVAA
jgi:glutathione S-transferase